MENHIEIAETKQDKGFTLVELLIVIVILGILATVTVFAVTGITNKGKTSACDSDAKTVQTAEEAYNANTGSYTEDEAVLVSAGLLHAESSKVDVAVTLGDPGDPTATPPVPATLDTYEVQGVANGDCDGMTW